MGDLSAFDRQQKVEQHGHDVVYASQENIKAKIVVSAVGGLVEPKAMPESIPGKDKFQGEIFHSARWKYDVDVKDKDVIVVGTGCSAAQFVPELTKTYGAKKVTQIMRSPPWVVPRPEGPGGEEHWNKVGPWRNRNIPGHQLLLRYVNALLAEYDWRLFGMSNWNKKERAKVEKQLIEHMHKTVPQKYWEILTPNYAVCGKLSIFYGSSAWLINSCRQTTNFRRYLVPWTERPQDRTHYSPYIQYTGEERHPRATPHLSRPRRRNK
jgi:cation diffusion facilitator CzcD-associated flavoprotein CzcO